jgi:type IX secretion system PorP/SprF family membrane protein
MRIEYNHIKEKGQLLSLKALVRQFSRVKLKFYVIGLVTFFSVSALHSQDPQFTQFYANKLYLAPSFAGATKQNRVSAIYRNQWAAVPGAFNTFAFSFDHYFSTFNSGVGLLLVRDVAGSGNLGLTNIGVQYSYDFQVNDYWHIRPGLHFLYSMYGLDFDKLIFGDQVSTGSGSSFEDPPYNNHTGDLDASTSVLVYSDKIWAGLTVDHLFRPNQSFYNNKSNVPMRYTLFGGYQIVRKGRLLKPIDESLSVAYMYRQQKDDRQLDLGLYWYKSPIMMGFWYRGIPILNSDRGDAIATMVGFKIENFSIGYSYDFTISNLINSTSGSHEVSLVYEFQTTHKKKIHAIPCPEF